MSASPSDRPRLIKLPEKMQKMLLRPLYKPTAAFLYALFAKRNSDVRTEINCLYQMENHP